MQLQDRLVGGRKGRHARSDIGGAPSAVQHGAVRNSTLIGGLDARLTRLRPQAARSVGWPSSPAPHPRGEGNLEVEHQDLARAAGVSPTTVNLLEGGRPPRKATADKIVRAFDVHNVSIIGDGKASGAVLRRGGLDLHGVLAESTSLSVRSAAEVRRVGALLIRLADSVQPAKKRPITRAEIRRRRRPESPARATSANPP